MKHGFLWQGRTETDGEVRAVRCNQTRRGSINYVRLKWAGAAIIKEQTTKKKKKKNLGRKQKEGDLLDELTFSKTNVNQRTAQEECSHSFTWPHLCPAYVPCLCSVSFIPMSSKRIPNFFHKQSLALSIQIFSLMIKVWKGLASWMYDLCLEGPHAWFNVSY